MDSNSKAPPPPPPPPVVIDPNPSFMKVVRSIDTVGHVGSAFSTGLCAGFGYLCAGLDWKGGLIGGLFGLSIGFTLNYSDTSDRLRGIPPRPPPPPHSPDDRLIRIPLRTGEPLVIVMEGSCCCQRHEKVDKCSG